MHCASCLMSKLRDWPLNCGEWTASLMQGGEWTDILLNGEWTGILLNERTDILLSGEWDDILLSIMKRHNIGRHKVSK